MLWRIQNKEWQLKSFVHFYCMLKVGLQTSAHMPSVEGRLIVTIQATLCTNRWLQENMLLFKIKEKPQHCTFRCNSLYQVSSGTVGIKVRVCNSTIWTLFLFSFLRGADDQIIDPDLEMVYQVSSILAVDYYHFSMHGMNVIMRNINWMEIFIHTQLSTFTYSI